jgi:anti-sigma-K factor RskA
MSFEEFEHQARLYVVGALEHEELAAFETARHEHGAKAESSINECRRLSAAFALTLRPQAPKQDAKARLMAMIQKSLHEKSRQA